VRALAGAHREPYSEAKPPFRLNLLFCGAAPVVKAAGV